MNEMSRVETAEERRIAALRYISQEARDTIRRVNEARSCDCGWCRKMDLLATVAEKALDYE